MPGKKADPSLYGGADYKCRAVWCTMRRVVPTGVPTAGSSIADGFRSPVTRRAAGRCEARSAATGIGVKDGRIAAIAPQGRGFD
jgi:hypothetical protein